MSPQSSGLATFGTARAGRPPGLGALGAPTAPVAVGRGDAVGCQARVLRQLLAPLRLAMRLVLAVRPAARVAPAPAVGVRPDDAVLPVVAHAHIPIKARRSARPLPWRDPPTLRKLACASGGRCGGTFVCRQWASLWTARRCASVVGVLHGHLRRTPLGVVHVRALAAPARPDRDPALPDHRRRWASPQLRLLPDSGAPQAGQHRRSSEQASLCAARFRRKGLVGRVIGVGAGVAASNATPVPQTPIMDVMSDGALLRPGL